jgi:hypothetical protein
MDLPVRNPAIASTLAILSATVVGLGLYLLRGKRAQPVGLAEEVSH